MKRVVFIIWLSCIYFAMAADSPKIRRIDSLKAVLQHTRTDTTRLDLLAKVAWLNTSVDLSMASLYCDTLAAELESCRASRKYKDPRRLDLTEAELHNTRGTICFYRGDLKSAIALYLKTLAISDKYGLKDKVAGTYNNVGTIYYTLKDYPDALKYFTLSKGIKEELLKDDPDNRTLKILLSKALNNIGSLHGELKRYDSALVYLERSLKLKIECKDRTGVAGTKNNIGEVLSMSKQYDKAEAYYQEALKEYEELGDPQGTALCLNGIGLNFGRKGDSRKGLEYFKRAETICLANGFMDNLKLNYEQQAIAYENTGNLKASLDYLHKFIALNDTLNSRAITEQSMELATKYESEKKEQENKLLNTKNNLSAETIKRQKITGYFITAGLLLALVLLVSIFRGLRNQKRANAIIEKQKQETEHQKQLVEVKNKEITDSIVYASRIQKAMLASGNAIRKQFGDHFILFKPKDIVSGDFYWALKQDKKMFMVTADCTGHGVPGAMMSMLGINLLHEIVAERRVMRPDEILNQLRREIIRALNSEEADEESKDGMDCSVLVLDLESLELEYAGANNSFYIFRNGAAMEQKADKMPVGKSPKEETSFTYNRIRLEKNDVVVTITDGFADQFGGPYGKKFKYKPMEDLLLQKSGDSLEKLGKDLEGTFEEWRGKLEQVDDVCAIGIRI